MVYDEGGAVLDLTLFGFDREDQASRLFGWLRIKNFRDLLKADENVLTDTRDGLDRHHPFTQALAAEVDQRLRPVVEHERHLRLQTAPAQLTRQQRKRLGFSVHQINTLLHGLPELRIGVGSGSSVSLTSPPESGLEFRPQRVFLHPKMKTPLRLLIDTSQLAAGETVEVQVNGQGIQASPDSFQVPDYPGTLVAVQYVVLSGAAPAQQALVEARAGRFKAHLEVKVVEEEYPEPEGGFAFMPAALRLPNNSRRMARLYVKDTTAKVGDIVTFSTNNPLIATGSKQVQLKEQDFRHGTARVEISVRGAGIGEKAQLTASLRQQQAQLTAEVVSRRENPISQGRQLVTGYRFDRHTPSRVRASYDETTGLIWIYLLNPIVARYFGDLPLEVALNAPHCQIF